MEKMPGVCRENQPNHFECRKQQTKRHSMSFYFIPSFRQFAMKIGEAIAAKPEKKHSSHNKSEFVKTKRDNL